MNLNSLKRRSEGRESEGSEGNSAEGIGGKGIGGETAQRGGKNQEGIRTSAVRPHALYVARERCILFGGRIPWAFKRFTRSFLCENPVFLDGTVSLRDTPYVLILSALAAAVFSRYCVMT